MPISLFILLLCFPLSVSAGWTGIAGFLGSGESDWALTDGNWQSEFTHYGLSIEDKTDVDIRVGASAAQFDLRLIEIGNRQNIQKYSGNQYSLYLRWPVELTRTVKWHSDLHFVYHSGDNLGQANDETIKWNEWVLNLGISVQLGRLSLRPFINLRDLDGDITGTGIRLLELVYARSSGLIADYMIEPSAFIRFRYTGAENPSMQVSLVREY